MVRITPATLALRTSFFILLNWTLALRTSFFILLNWYFRLPENAIKKVNFTGLPWFLACL